MYASTQTALRSMRAAIGEDDLWLDESLTYPVPVRRGRRIQLLGLVYRFRGLRDEEPRADLPHVAAWIDARTGLVTSIGPCSAEELGITDPDARPWPKPPPLDVPWWKIRDEQEARLDDVSATVHEAFDRGMPATGEIGELARLYYELIRYIVNPVISPFYDQAAHEFFEWLRAAAPSARGITRGVVPPPVVTGGSLPTSHGAARDALTFYPVAPQAVTLAEGGATRWHVRCEAAASPLLLERIDRARAARNPAIQAVTDCLVAAHVATPRILATRTGELQVDLAERGVFRLWARPEGVAVEAIRREAQAWSAGELTGRFHAALERCKFRFPAPTVRTPDASHQLGELCRALATHSRHALRDGVEQLAEDIANALEALEPLDGPWLAVGHGHLSVESVQFVGGRPPEGDRAAFLFNLDGVGPISVAWELGEMWRTWCARTTAIPPAFDVTIMEAAWRGWQAGRGRAATSAELHAALHGVEHVSLARAAQLASDVLLGDPLEDRLMRAASALALHLVVAACRPARESALWQDAGARRT